MWLNIKYTQASPSINLLNIGTIRSFAADTDNTISSGRPVVVVAALQNRVITLVNKGNFSTDIEAANAYASAMSSAINVLFSGSNTPDSVIDFPPPFNLEVLTMPYTSTTYAY